jgi:cysteine-rich repeat protein
MRVAHSLARRSMLVLRALIVIAVVVSAALALADTERVSVDSAGMQANAGSAVSGISADGRRVAFASTASNLVPADTNLQSDVFVRDRTAGATLRMSVDSSGAQATGSSITPAMAGDGNTVTFVSSAANLVAGDTNGRLDVFVHDLVTGGTERMSVASDGAQATSDSFAPSLSHDGRRVAFVSLASNLVGGDTNNTFDVFVHDRTTATTVRVSVDSAGMQTNGPSFAPRLSADGLMIVFHSQATNLVAGDTNGVSDVFVHDLATGTTSRVSVGSMGEQGNFASTAGTLSADGRFAAFTSDASTLVASDTNGATDVFVHDRSTGMTERVSVDGAGLQGNMASGFLDPPALSADGSRTAFMSAATNLVTGDANNSVDVFVHDRSTGETVLANVATDGTQANAASVLWASLSADGRTVAFASLANNLVPGDTNTAQDIFVQFGGCGDGAVQGAEECDDGGRADGDCCSSTCMFEAAGSACTDGDLCTQLDACDGQGACASDPVVCTDETAECHAPAACDPSTGACASAPLPDGSACEDGDLCTEGDACVAGECARGDFDPEACADAAQCYKASPAPGSPSPRRDLMLADVFGEARYRVKHAEGLCTAVEVKVEPGPGRSGVGIVSPADPKAMLSCHYLRVLSTEPPQPAFVKRLVRLKDRLGTRVLEVEEPSTLCVAAGDRVRPTDGLSYTCYEAREPHHSSMEGSHHRNREDPGVAVRLKDRFRTWSTSLLEPDMLCAPTRMAEGDEVRVDAALVCFEVSYKILKASHFFWPRRQRTHSTLGSGTLDLWRPKRVCMPAEITEITSLSDDD